MFEEKQELRELKDAAWAAFGHKERGVFLSYDEMEAIVGSRRSHPGAYLIAWFVRELLNVRDIDTIAERGTGIRLLTNAEQYRIIGDKRQRKAYRQINRGLKSQRKVDGTALSDHDRRGRLGLLDHLVRQRLYIGRGVRELAKSAHKSAVHPKRKAK